MNTIDKEIEGSEPFINEEVQKEKEIEKTETEFINEQEPVEEEPKTGKVKSKDKTSKAFKDTINQYLLKRAEEDKLFAAKYVAKGKNLDDCITYILNTVQKSGIQGFTDDEVFSMAVHYYDEEKIDVGKPIDCQVVVNHTIELTDEEKEQARQDAIKKVHDDAVAKMTKKPDPKKVKEHKKELKEQKANPQPGETLSLF